MKNLVILVSLMLLAIFSYAENSYYSKRRMAQASDLIFVGKVKFIEKGNFNGYNQKVYFEVENQIKGSTSKNIVVLGNTDSECGITRFSEGRYLLFLEKKESYLFESGIERIFVSINYDNGIHRINDNKIWWRSEKVDPQIGSYTDLNFVVSEVGEFSKVPWGNQIF
jgi:hypothetical protein